MSAGNCPINSSKLFCWNFPVKKYRINSRTNFCCNFLPCFVQNRSLRKAPPCAEIIELIPVGFFCGNLAATKLPNQFAETIFAPGIYFGDNSSIAKGVSHPFCLVFMWYRASIAEIPFCGAGGGCRNSTSHALQVSKGKRSEKGEGVSHPIGHAETPKTL